MTLPARILFYLPSVRAYADRIRMLAEVANGVERFVLLIGRDDGLSDLPEWDGIDVVSANFGRGGRPVNLWKANRIASRLIRQERINVVHDTFGNLLPLMYMRGRFPETKFCTSLFNLIGWRAKHVWGDMPLHRLLRSRGGALMYFNRWIERRVVLKSDRVIIQAPGLAPRLRGYIDIPDERIPVITNNVETEFWRPSTERAVHGEDHTELRLLFIGGIGTSRGGPAMVEMLGDLIEDGIDAKLTLIGEWERFAEKPIRQLIRERGLGDRVSIPGRVSREGVRDAFQSHDLFLYQTVNDGSPRIVLEAMSSGIPVLASNHPGVQVLDPEKQVLTLTEYSDVPAMVERAKSFVEDPNRWWDRASLGSVVAAESFSPEIVANQYHDVYRKMISA